MNRRIRAPLIWPPNRNDTSKLTSSDFSAGPSVSWTQRIARPVRRGAWNMVGAFISVSTSPVSGSSMPSVRVDSTDWLIARLPALAIARMRSPGLAKMCSLRKVETLSRPAFVRVSAIMTSPSRTKIPQQYVISEPRNHPITGTKLVTNFAGLSNPVFRTGMPAKSLSDPLRVQPLTLRWIDEKRVVDGHAQRGDEAVGLRGHADDGDHLGVFRLGHAFRARA